MRVLRYLAALGLATSVSGVAFAEPIIHVRFSIEQQELGSALTAFAKQAHVQILGRDEDVLTVGKIAPAIRGELSPREALERLLAKTGLTFEFINEHTVRISSTATSADNSTSEAPAAAEPMRLSQSDASVQSSSGSPRSGAMVDEEGNLTADSSTSAPDSSKFTVDEIVVTAERYGAKVTTVGRLAVPYIDTPQSASVVTSELMADANLFDTNAALTYVPGVKNGSTFGDQNIRGVAANGSYTDGFANAGGLSSQNSTSAPAAFDTFLAERIEVVEGPSPGSFGRGDPAGFINFVSKLPTFTEQTEVGVLGGTGDHVDRRFSYRATVDQNGLLSDDHQTAYRLLAFDTEGAQSMDYSGYKRAGAQLSVTHKLKDDSGRLDVIASFQNSEISGLEDVNALSSPSYINYYRNFLGQYGLIVPNFTPFRGNFQFGANEAQITQDNFRMTAILDYKLSEHWRTRQAASINSFHEDGAFGAEQPFDLSYSPSGALLYSQSLGDAYGRASVKSYQSDFLGAYDIDRVGGKVSLLFGGDITDGYQSFANTTTATATVTQPVIGLNPNVAYGPFMQNPAEVALTTSGPDWSAYAQGQLKLLHDAVQLSAGVRKIWQHQQNVDVASGVVTSLHASTPVLPVFSLLVKPQPWLSVYTTASQWLEPAVVSKQNSPVATVVFPPDVPASIANATISLQPKTTLLEEGVKGSLLKGQLTFSLIHYHEESSGNPINTTNHVQLSDGSTVLYGQVISGNNVVQGWEYEAFGQITRRLSFMLGGEFGVNSSQLGSYNGIPITSKVSGVGNELFGYATYTLGKDTYDGLGFTAGWKTYFSGWSIAFATYPYPTPYPSNETTVDLGISYGFNEQYKIFLKGDNLFHSDAMPLGIESTISGRLVYAGVMARF